MGIRLPPSSNRGFSLMTEPQVTLDPNSLNPVEEKLRGPLEEQLTSALKAATDQTRQTYAGESVEVVCRQLLERAKEHLHPDIAAGFQPDHDQLLQVASAIAAGR
jgi:hypothetical protein